MSGVPALSACSGSSGSRMARVIRSLLEREGIRYALIGVVNTLFGYAVFAALEITLGSVLPYLVVLLMAHVVAVLEAFVLHRRVTFRAQGHLWLDLLRFQSVYLGALALNLVLLPLLVELGGVPVLLAQPIVLLVVALGTYAGHKSFSFRRATAAHAEPDATPVPP